MSSSSSSSSPSVLAMNGLFSSRETLEEAITYSQELLSTLPTEHQIAALTAYWVTLNTALAKIEKSNPHNVRPIPMEDLPKEVKLPALTQDQLTVMIRTLLAPTMSQLHQLFNLPLIGELVEGPSTFVAMVSLYFGVSRDELLAEIRAYRAS